MVRYTDNIKCPTCLKKTRDGIDENQRTFRGNPLYTYTQEAGRKGSPQVTPQLQLDVSRN